MELIEETLDATLDSNGQLWLSNQPRLPPGPVRVTIRVASNLSAGLFIKEMISDTQAKF